MGADIFGERFTARDEAAWWDVLGANVHDQDLTARAALQEAGADYEVGLRPLFYETGDEGWESAKVQAIVRGPVAEDPQPAVFGVVSPDYELITPQDACAIYDERVAQPIETLGALGKGETFFITTRLPKIDVRGDEVENYLLLYAPMDGRHAASVEDVPVRVVCRNTLNLAQSLATQVCRVVHDTGAKVRLGEWLQGVYEEAVSRVELITEAFEVMASARLANEAVTAVLEATYRLPAAPRQDAPASVLTERARRWEQQASRIGAFRAGALELFAGRGIGQDLPATQGTAWGLYNAVCETEDYRRAHNEDDASIVAQNLLTGDRAATKRRAFAECLAASN